ncbi:related to taurine dioxygenase [Ramularia collo-cygni]|uniref:Related to taurine dioxygenase n=1 Tax=Ramularia collo-cygni TaxID=112498 RepID=A0A2D3UWG6_9PEZI|nr:related to taurine dioxygenase [Ramularia collo-cygni]CZT15406.1 related to taurine dioxygenase [Ramularia collo-cygni]
MSKRGPLSLSTALENLEWHDVTPVIGREFPKAQLLDMLDNDAMLRDLAITVSERNVVFFRNQSLDAAGMKVLAQKLGELSGKPETSKLHRHALSNSKRGDENDNKTLDDEISVISNKTASQFFHEEVDRLASEGWHADISTEQVPSDYAAFKMLQLPSTGEVGGDTLWASGYEVYDRMSAPWKRFAEQLTATHRDNVLIDIAKKDPSLMLDRDRGSPENKGLEFTVSHPVVRTNPVTGWKSLYGAAGQIGDGWIDGMRSVESELLKSFFLQLIAQNHDLQVRWRWSVNDVAIWDNRSTFHSATFDYQGVRLAQRVTSVGERPFYDPQSISRREALALRRGQVN